MIIPRYGIISDEEILNWKSQIVISNEDIMGLSRFTRTPKQWLEKSQQAVD